MSRKILLLLSIFAIHLSSFSQTCFSDQITADLRASDPTYDLQRSEMISRIPSMLTPPANAAVVIPLKVHYVHHSGMPSLAAITPEINDMITQLNLDYNKQNPDTASVRSTFVPVISNVEIEFCLDEIIDVPNSEACYDPDTETNKMKDAGTGGSNTVDPDHYLNVWIVDICSSGGGSTVAGYAYLPTPGMHGSSIDGFVVDYVFVGLGDRTATHEIGHYLGLCHPWGCSGGGCGDDDGFSDTPLTDDPTFPCSDDGACGTPVQYENFMDYSFCSHMFTLEQGAYMNNILNTTRSSLKAGFGCASGLIGPNADFTASTTYVCAGESVTFTDASSGGTPDTYSWSFSGGSPSTSTAASPTVTYATPGTYDVTMTATNAFGTDTETKVGYITVAAIASLPLSEGFESTTFPPTNWTLANGDGSFTWERTTGASGYGTSTACAYINNYDYNATGELDWLITPPLDFSGATAPELSFDYAYARYDAVNFDSLLVVYSTDCGNSWFLAYSDGNSGLSTAPDNSGRFIPGPSEWSTVTLDFSALAGEASVRVGFVNKNGYGNSLLLDNINLIAAPAGPSTPVANFVASATTVPVGSSLNFTDLSTNAPTSWNWSFTGGAPVSSTVQNPTGILYSTVGTYQVSLTATNASGSGIETKVDYITVYDTLTPSTSCDDTTYWMFGQAAFVSVEDTAGFSTSLFDEDGLTPDPGLVAGGVTSGWQTWIEVIAPGDTNYFLGATSWFDPPATADNWINFGPITIPSGGANLRWRSKIRDNGFRDGYEVLINTGGNDPADFSLAPVLFSVTDNDPSTDGDTVWADHIVPIDGITYGGMEVYIGFHHDATDMFFMDFDDIIIEKCRPDNVPVAEYIQSDDTVCQGDDILFTSVYETAPTSWNWSFPGGTPSTSSDESPTINYGTPGTYDVTLIVSSVDGSDTIARTGVVVVNPRPTGTVSTGSSVTCFGGTDGSLTATASGGSAPFTYNWSSGQTTATASGLGSGTYTVTVTNAEGCTADLSGSVGGPFSPIVISSSVTDETCDLDNGAISAAVSGGYGSFTYAWSTGPTTSAISGLNAGSYTLTVTDGGGCTSVKVETVTDLGSSMGVTPFTTDVICTSPGGAVMTVSGGTEPYTYSWSSGETTSFISGVSAGSYGFTATDAIGCLLTSTVVINNSSYDLDLGFSTTNATCGASDGTATVIFSTGVGAKTYSWSSGGTASTETGIPSGNYTVTVTDENGCTGIDSTDVIDSGAPSISVFSSDVSCFGGSNGSLVITGSGGSAPYTFSLDGITFGGSATFSGLSAGTYNPTIKGADGCTSALSETISQPTELFANASGVADEICGGSDGSVSAAPSGGTAGYSYAWSSGGTSSSESGLIAGTYTVTVTDANACTDIETAVVGTIDGPTASASVVADESCDGADNGAALAAGTGGTAPLNYNWSTGATTASASSLAPGAYQVTITDDNACTDTASVVIAAGAPISGDITGTPIACAGDANGTATVSVVDGTGPYTYAWSTGGSTASISSLGVGFYVVTFTDALGCTNDTSIVIGGPPASLIVNATATDEDCGLDNGTATANVTGAGWGAPYSYSWSSGGSSASLSGLGVGTYTVSVTDAGGCEKTATATVNAAGTTLAGTTTTEDEVCTTLGSATVSASGGTAPYTYAWSSGGTGATETGLAAGSYSVTISDVTGCDILETVTVSNSSYSVTLSMTASDATCGGSDGTATATPTVGIAPLSYAWSTGGSTDNITGLIAGTYTVTATDANGCSGTNTVSVADSPPPSISVSSIDVSCFGGSDGSITISGTGGSTPYNYSIDGTSFGGLGVFSGLSAGSYDAIVRGANGCTDTLSVTLTEPAALAPSTSSVDDTCSNAVGSAMATPTGGTAPYSYIWTGGGSTSSLSGLTAGTYFVTVLDANSCIAIESVVVGNIPGPSMTSAVISDESCDGAADGVAVATATGGVGPYSYAWSTGATTDTVTGLAPGSVTVTVTDANGCFAINTVNISAGASVSLSLSVTNESCSGLADGTALASTTSGSEPFTYLWSDGQTTQTATGLAPGSYTVTATSAEGCEATSSATIAPGGSLAVTATAVDASDTLAGDGSATAVPSGGTAPYTYLWTDGQTTETATGLPAGTFSVTVTDADGCVGTATVTVGITVGIQDLMELGTVKLYPNPTHDRITLDIELTEVQDLDLVVFNSLGQQVHSAHYENFLAGKEVLDLSGQSHGLYYVQLTTETASQTFKVTKLSR